MYIATFQKIERTSLVPRQKGLPDVSSMYMFTTYAYINVLACLIIHVYISIAASFNL